MGTAVGADAFCDDVLDHSARYYPGSKFDFWDVGDPAGMSRSPTDMRTYFQIAHGKGILMEPAIQTLSIRLECVRRPLRTIIDGRPQFVLHPRCSETRKAMLGGYHFRRMRISGERYTNEPEKNLFANPADALGYGATRFFGSGMLAPQHNRGQMEEQGGNNGQGRAGTTGY